MLHQYAEDCQICIATPVSDASPIVIRLQECLCQVDAWMSSSRLQLNHKKTEEMWLGSRQQLDKLSVQQVMVVSSPVTVSSHARDLGVIIDSQLSLSGHVNALCQSCYYQLRPVISSKSEDVVRTLVHAFVSCRLDYCNSLFFGMTDDLFQRLQGIQNAAARLVTGTSRREHITTVLRRLHWLPVRQRTEFKLALLIHSPGSVSCHRTLLTTVSSSRTPVGTRFDRRILRCSLFDAPTAHLVIGVSLSLEPGSGTVSHPLCAQLTCPLNGSNRH